MSRSGLNYFSDESSGRSKYVGYFINVYMEFN